MSYIPKALQTLGMGPKTPWPQSTQSLADGHGRILRADPTRGAPLTAKLSNWTVFENDSSLSHLWGSRKVQCVVCVYTRVSPHTRVCVCVHMLAHLLISLSLVSQGPKSKHLSHKELAGGSVLPISGILRVPSRLGPGWHQ